MNMPSPLPRSSFGQHVNVLAVLLCVYVFIEPLTILENHHEEQSKPLRVFGELVLGSEAVSAFMARLMRHR